MADKFVNVVIELCESFELLLCCLFGIIFLAMSTLTVEVVVLLEHGSPERLRLADVVIADADLLIRLDGRHGDDPQFVADENLDGVGSAAVVDEVGHVVEAHAGRVQIGHVVDREGVDQNLADDVLNEDQLVRVDVLRHQVVLVSFVKAYFR